MNEIDLESKLPPISIKAEPLFDIPTPFGSFAFTNSMLYTLIVIGVLAIFFFLATRRMSIVPKAAQNLAESIVELLLGITEGTAGKSVGRRIFPLIATLFIFILVANYAGLLPGVGTIGYCAEERSTEPTEQTLVVNARTAAPLAQEPRKAACHASNAGRPPTVRPASSYRSSERPTPTSTLRWRWRCWPSASCRLRASRHTECLATSRS